MLTDDDTIRVRFSPEHLKNKTVFLFSGVRNGKRWNLTCTWSHSAIDLLGPDSVPAMARNMLQYVDRHLSSKFPELFAGDGIEDCQSCNGSGKRG